MDEALSGKIHYRKLFLSGWHDAERWADTAKKGSNPACRRISSNDHRTYQARRNLPSTRINPRNTEGRMKASVNAGSRQNERQSDERLHLRHTCKGCGATEIPRLPTDAAQRHTAVDFVRLCELKRIMKGKKISSATKKSSRASIGHHWNMPGLLIPALPLRGTEKWSHWRMPYGYHGQFDIYTRRDIGRDSFRLQVSINLPGYPGYLAVNFKCCK